MSPRPSALLNLLIVLSLLFNLIPAPRVARAAVPLAAPAPPAGCAISTKSWRTFPGQVTALARQCK